MKPDAFRSAKRSAPRPGLGPRQRRLAWLVVAAALLPLLGPVCSHCGVDGSLPPDPGGAALPPEGFGTKLADHPVFWLALVAAGLAAGGIYLYAHRVRRSVARLQAAAARMAAGQLDTDAAAAGGGVFGGIGEALNEIAANQQEILLHVWNRAQNSLALIDGICGRLPDRPDAALYGDLQRLRRDVQFLQTLGEGAELYGIQIAHGRILSDGDEPACTGKPWSDEDLRN